MCSSRLLGWCIFSSSSYLRGDGDACFKCPTQYGIASGMSVRPKAAIHRIFTADGFRLIAIARIQAANSGVGKNRSLRRSTLGKEHVSRPVAEVATTFIQLRRVQPVGP